MATKQIPYGLTDFERIRTANYYYVDKTRYIAEVERNASFFFLIRPRRFGKSLFLNVLRWYYDVNRKDSFEELFGDLYIGSHPTPEQGQYLVLDFNFAGVNPDPDELIRSFNDHCAARFREFAYYYERFFNPGFREKMESLPNADEKLTYTISEAKRLNLSIYLFIDEYDNFTNAILANMGEKHYKALTHGTGFFRYFFNKLKEGATGDGPIKRMYITGVSAVQYEMDLFTDRLGGELKVGASTTIAQYVLPQVLARFTARFPEVKVSLASGNSEQVEAALARHDTDLGLVESSARHPGFHYEPFIPDELVLIASTKGRYGRCDQVTLAELQTVPLVLRESGSGTLEVISKYLAAADVRLASLRVVMQLGSTESIKSFVRNSDAMAIVSVASIVDELRSGELRIIDIEGCTIRREFSFCWPEGRSDALAARFVEFARHTA